MMLIRIRSIVFFMGCLLVSCLSVLAQTGNYKDSNTLIYIAKHKNLAISEMLRTGMPASIKLAQGIVETDAGTSDLVLKSNNHFGVKCKKEWQGEKVYHNDDAEGECFRKYQSDTMSYIDQSNFLIKSSRYARAFATDPLDYKNWIKEIKNAGYATNPKYVAMITKIIEDFGLQAYTLIGLKRNNKLTDKEFEEYSSAVTFRKQYLINKDMDTSSIALAKNTSNYYFSDLLESAPSNTFVPSMDSSLTLNKTLTKEFNVITVGDNEQKFINNIDFSEDEIKVNYDNKMNNPEATIIVTTNNKLKALKVDKGTSLLLIALKYNVDFSKLLMYNDFPYHANLTQKEQLIYLQPKFNSSTKEFHTVKENETLYDIAQQEGVALTTIRKYNIIPYGMEPKENEKIYLNNQAPQKPQLYSIN